MMSIPSKSAFKPSSCKRPLGPRVRALKVLKIVLFLQLTMFFHFVECGVDPSLLSDTRLERLGVLLSLDALGAT